MYKFQIADITNSERPEYEVHKNSGWETIFEEENADDLLCKVSNWLNDENYPTSHWTRIVKDNVVLQSGLYV